MFLGLAFGWSCTADESEVWRFSILNNQPPDHVPDPAVVCEHHDIIITICLRSFEQIEQARCSGIDGVGNIEIPDAIKCVG